MADRTLKLRTLRKILRRYGVEEDSSLGKGSHTTFYKKFPEGTFTYLKEKFGSPEAVWEMTVKDFPAVVTMDSHGRSLHAEVADVSKAQLATVL